MGLGGSACLVAGPGPQLARTAHRADERHVHSDQREIYLRRRPSDNGGRWVVELRDCRLPAAARDTPAPPGLPSCPLCVCFFFFSLPWSTDVLTAAMQTFAASLSTLPAAGLSWLDGPDLIVSDVLADRTGPVLGVLAGWLLAHA